jgi:hypothetical protein
MKIDTALRAALPLASLGLAEIAFAVLAARVIDRETAYPLYLAAYLAMGLFWLIATYYALARAPDSRASRGVVVVVAVLVRVPFLVTAPVLSDDIFRYIWDGRVQHAGINPYLYAPGDEAVAFLREGHEVNYAGINNKDIPTIYPPFMQVAFYAATFVSESVWWMKTFFVVIDIALIFVLMRLLGALELSATRVVAYAWSPLAIVEVAASGHNDVLGGLFLMLALSAIVCRRSSPSVLFLTLSGMAKVIGYTLTPLFLRSVRPRALLVMPVVTVLLALPYASAGSLAFRGLTQYGLRWRGNDGAFHVLYYLTGSLDTAKLIVAAVLVAMVLALVALDANPLRSSYLTVGAILLLTTTVHPWYLLWIAPFLAIYPSPAWLYLTLGVGLAYHSAYLASPGQPWEDVVWVKLVEYVPFFVLAVAGAWRERRAWRRLVGLNSPP